MTYFILFYLEIIVFAGNIVIREFIDICWACSSNNQKRKRKIYCLENNGTLSQVFYANAIHHLQTACYLEWHMTHLKSTGT